MIGQVSLGRNRSYKTAEEGCIVKKFLVFLAGAVVFICSPNWVQAETIFALATDNGLLTFDSGSPDKITRIGTITGVLPGEAVVGIDFRPATGQLYSLSLVPVGPTFFGRLSVIDTVTAAATPVGGRLDLGILAGTAYGIDFDPITDLLRVVSNAGSNLRASPITGQAVGVDGPLTYAPGDAHFGSKPSVVGSAYTTTRLFGIDSGLDTLLAQDPPNDGILHTVGPLGFNTSELVGFDISGATGIAYASLTPEVGIFFSGLYTIDLATGTATFVGNIGSGGPLIRGIAVAQAAPVPEPCTWAMLSVAVLALFYPGRRAG
jgi:hypothetical protein